MDFLNDNTDNGNNGKNGRNCGCHEVTYNTDNGITSATENVVIGVFVDIVVTVVIVVFYNVRGIAWKAILSEAVVTEGEALGISMLSSCLEGSTSYQTTPMARYCLTDSSPPYA